MAEALFAFLEHGLSFLALCEINEADNVGISERGKMKLDVAARPVLAANGCLHGVDFISIFEGFFYPHIPFCSYRVAIGFIGVRKWPSVGHVGYIV